MRITAVVKPVVVVQASENRESPWRCENSDDRQPFNQALERASVDDIFFCLLR